jgi:hypothetical protein
MYVDFTGFQVPERTLACLTCVLTIHCRVTLHCTMSARFRHSSIAFLACLCLSSMFPLHVHAASSTAMASQISAQCKADTEKLANNTALLAATPARRECFINVDETNSCQTDYSGETSEFERVCLGAGGQFHEADYTLDCSVSGYDANYYFMNVPTCLGASCTIEEWEAEQEAVVYPELERNITGQGQGFQCQVSAAAAVGHITAGGLSLITILSSVVLMVGVL